MSSLFEANHSKQVKKMSNANYTFPKNITDSNLKNKRIYIDIYESKSLDALPADLWKKSKKLGEKVWNAKSVIGAMNAIQQNIKDFNGEKEITITLPLPNELSDSQSHNFAVSEGILAEVISNIPGSDMIGKALGKIQSNLSEQKILPNPGYFQNYTGSDPRSFTFNFKLIPNDADEANEIVKIITVLKKYSSPELTAGAFLKAPRFFHIWVANETLQKMVQLRPCIITNVSTNYAGSSILETTLDGMPKYIELSISINELRAMTISDWGVD